MDALGAHSYDTLVKLEKESYYERSLEGGIYWRIRSSGDFFEMLLLFFTPHQIGIYWRCVTIEDVDLVPTLEEYNHFLSLSIPLSIIFVPLVRPLYHKRLTDLLGLKRPVIEALTCLGSGIGGCMSFDFLYDRFHSLECPVGYRDEFVDLEERRTSYRH